MKICTITIRDFQQFRDLELDLTYPADHIKSGQPLEKLCLIGKNGTGKSTILEFVFQYLSSIHNFRKIPFLLVKIKIDDIHIYSFNSNRNSAVVFLKEEIESISNWKNEMYDEFVKNRVQMRNSKFKEFIVTDEKVISKVVLRNNTNDLLIYSASEGNQNLYKQINDVPNIRLNDALAYFKTFPYSHIVTMDTIRDFWKLLIYLLKKRENDFLEFQNLPSNLDKTVRKVKAQFEQENPTILDKIGELWNSILNKAGLEFDIANASNPIQLDDNLKAYIKLVSSGQIIKYNQLSTGIRNFIFRVGHIYSLYFNRQISKGFILLDEPENSLFPDFLYDLVNHYFSITQNTQFFVATHSPIIAAQFEPFERIILDFNENGEVFTKRGETPVGDDPNDILIKDFGIHSLLGKEGVKKWERFIALKVLISEEENAIVKGELISEYLKIGNDYNFSEDEVFN